jgi:peptide/nickel transport system permease protein
MKHGLALSPSLPRRHGGFLGAKLGLHLRVVFDSWMGATGFGVLSCFVIVGIVGPWIMPHDPWKMLESLHPPSLRYPLGTTDLGYDILSRLIAGTRNTLIIGLVSGAVSIVIGGNIGLLAGYYRGRLDQVLMRLTDVAYGMPFLPFVIVLISLFGRNDYYLILAIGAIVWRTSARVIRAQTLSLAQRQFIRSARARGCSDMRIIYRHIVPNIMPLLLLYTSFNIAWAIVTEASASFLGFTDPSTITWGTMLYDLWVSGETRVAWWWFTAPSLCIVLLVTALVFISRAYEVHANPRLQGH